MGRVVLYLHGTATGYTSAEGNPGRQADACRSTIASSLSAIRSTRKPARRWPNTPRRRRLLQEERRSGREHELRITEPQIAASLASVEPDPNKRKERAKAIFNTVNKALEESFRAAPNILFVAGAGNEDEDVISSAASPPASTSTIC
jgi:hypothetical protein